MACSKEETIDDNLETFSIWWLDAEVNNEENREAQERLRSIINALKTWQSPDEFVQSVLRMSQDDRVVMIVSGRMGCEVLPRIHHLRQVSSVYVYCANKKANEQWAGEYRKIKGVFVELNELISHLRSNHKYTIKSEEPLAISAFKVDGNGGKTLTGSNSEFLNFQLLIEILVRMKLNRALREEFMVMCKERYKNDVEHLKVAKEFQTTYTSDKALWWYTRETFIYEILNKAFRTLNYDVLIQLHWFANDIRQQLSRKQCRQPIKVYRGQRMSTSELSGYQNLLGQFISTNAFFSTSFHKHVAIGFARGNNNNCSAKASADQGFKRVLFVINADPHVVTTTNRPFADISSIGLFPEEKEVLFMVGSIFRLDSIHLDGLEDHGDMFSIIRMTLCGGEQHDLHELYHCMRKEYGSGDTDLRALGTLLSNMGKFDLAQKYYRKMLNQVSPSDPVLGDLYHSLGCAAADKGEDDASLDWYSKALEVKMRTRPSDYVSIGQTYNNIGIVLQKKGNASRALEYYNKGMALFQQARDENHICMGALYHDVGRVYQEQRNFSKALSSYEKAVAIKEKHRPSNHPDLATSYNIIGYVHHCLGHRDLALQFYNRALKINLKALSPQHTEIALNYQNIGLLYGDMGQIALSLENLKSAKKIYRHSLPSDSAEVINVKKAIKIVSAQLDNK